ncbi:carotenoid 9,10(9',10')-cleavage dioxygenase 1-like [Rutidosis leptorrhynchoides]|uniref:carotenoid 9,10(9',10')-cleavage dioxygenase 1-like n=1 Tax=Rutidosis leptorrhynchoides TaxID=125765 RepID=UPI003A99249B
MTMATCALIPIVRCSTSNDQPTNFKVSDLKSAVSTAIKTVTRNLEKSPFKNEASIALKTASMAILDTLVDSLFQFVDQPMHPSQKNFAPVEEIGEHVEVDYYQGEIPEDFPEGIYVRNGPNPLFGGLKKSESVFGKTDSLWVEGEGMLHALRFTKTSKGEWKLYYKNRYVETDTYKIESKREKPAIIPIAEGDAIAVFAALFFNKMRIGIDKMSSNTSVFEHAGKYYSATENFIPQEIDIISLETIDNWYPGGTWRRAFTSHPKKAPGTGELVTVGFEPVKPYCVVGVISADGEEVVHKLDLQLDHCTFFHDVGVTNKYTVLIDSMVTLSVDRLMKGGQLIKYEREKDARIAVIPRYGDNTDSIKWFLIEPCVSYHLMNCFEDENEVVVRGCRANESILPGPDWGQDKYDWFSRAFTFKPVGSHDNESCHGSKEEGMLFAKVREWRLNMETFEVKERNLSGTEYSMDFPFINADFTGLKHQYGYTQVVDSVASSNAGQAKYGGLAKLYFEEHGNHSSVHGEENVKIEYQWLLKNNFCTGAAFVAKSDGVDEDDGWIVTFAHDEDNETSYVLVVDAKKFGDEPVAKINLPRRVPHGNHGAFFCLKKN